MATVSRDANEISNMEIMAAEWTAIGETDVPGMTYEEGVATALSWVLGTIDEDPIETSAPLEDDESEDE